MSCVPRKCVLEHIGPMHENIKKQKQKKNVLNERVLSYFLNMLFKKKQMGGAYVVGFNQSFKTPPTMGVANNICVQTTTQIAPGLMTDRNNKELTLTTF